MLRSGRLPARVLASTMKAARARRENAAMSYQTIEVRKLTPGIGAEIHGIDLSQPLGNQQFQEVHDALMDNLVIFFRDQNLTHRPAQGFRPPLRQAACPSERAAKLIASIRRSSSSRPTRTASMSPARNGTPTCPATPSRRWARSSTCTSRPPNGGGDTMFANMYAAYEALSDPMKRYPRRPDRDSRLRARRTTIAAATAPPTSSFRRPSIR